MEGVLEIIWIKHLFYNKEHPRYKERMNKVEWGNGGMSETGTLDFQSSAYFTTLR